MTLYNNIFDIDKHLGIKLLTRLCLGPNHLHEHKFRLCFHDTLNPSFECGKDNESIMHFLFHCAIPRQTFTQKIRNFDYNILSESETQLILKMFFMAIKTGLSILEHCTKNDVFH